MKNLTDDSVLALFSSHEKSEVLNVLISLGRNAARTFPEALKTEANEVPGCSARTWLSSSFDGERLHYSVCSDSAIIGGTAYLLVGMFTDLTPGDALERRIDILETLGIQQHLTYNRRQGIVKIHSLVRDFAIAQT